MTYYIDVITYLCQIPDAFITPFSHLSLGLSVSYALFNTVTWMIAAEFHGNVRKTFAKWCQACKPYVSKEDHSKLLLVKLEMNAEPIALSCEFFDISYRFIASVNQ